MRKLNLEGSSDQKQRHRLVPVAEPRLYECAVRGKSLVVDAQNLLAAEITEDRYPAPCDMEPQFTSSAGTYCRMVCLNLTHGCNLRCAYCFVRNYNPDHEFPMMSFRVARRAINFIQHNPGKKQGNPPIRLTFFGGEPLVAFRRMQEIVAYAEKTAAQRGCGAQFHVTTNGTLIDDEKAAWLADHRFSLIVSLDGEPEVHDRHRLNAKGEGSHAEVMAGLERLKGREGLKTITLRGTFTGEGVDLAGRLEYLNDLCDQGLAQSVSVEPVNLTEDGCAALVDGHGLAITEENVGEFAEQYGKAAQWIVDRARAGKKVRFHQMVHMIRRIATQKHSPTECGAGMGIVTVNAGGDVFACHREGPTKIGDVWYGLDERLRAKWLENRIYGREGCVECDFRWICGGGCREYSLTCGLPISKPHPVECELKKMWITNALWVLSELDEDQVREVIGVKADGCCP